MSRRFTVRVGKFARLFSKLHGGSGSAFPGLVVEKIDKKFISSVLGELPKGVVIVSGTNGKTTTTKMTTELLESQGLRVFTNKSGSNFVRGVIAALLEAVDSSGKLSADIAVLELDEAHAVRFIDLVKPKYSLLLNVMRDQLDRFGEIDATADMLKSIAEATTDTVVMNREDKRLRSIEVPANIVYYGIDKSLRQNFPNDDELLSPTSSTRGKLAPARIVLSSFKGKRAEFTMGNKTYSTKLAVEGIYNTYNATAALTLVNVVLPKVSIGELLTPLSKITPAFGRGETIMNGGRKIQLILVKNPSGFQLALQSFKSRGHHVAIAVNDAYADGRDMSWLWNVDFSALDRVEVVGGVRATDMALRLKYDEVPVDNIEENLYKFVRQIQGWKGPGYVFASYTAMLKIRKLLAGRSIS